MPTDRLKHRLLGIVFPAQYKFEGHWLVPFHKFDRLSNIIEPDQTKFGKFFGDGQVIIEEHFQSFGNLIPVLAQEFSAAIHV